jgi:hypothetical protein
VTRSALIIAVTALLTVSAGAAERRFVGGARCSLIEHSGFRYPGETYFLATTTADTMRAGAGPIGRATTAWWSFLKRARVHGQVVRVGELGADVADSPVIERAFSQAGSRDAVVVPWSHTPSCAPEMYGGSAIWMRPGATVVLRVGLRDPKHWADDTPTFDGRVAVSLYSQSSNDGGWMTTQEFFDFYNSLPLYPESKAEAAAARRYFETWMSANPHLAVKQPAAMSIEHAFETIRHIENSNLPD